MRRIAFLFPILLIPACGGGSDKLPQSNSSAIAEVQGGQPVRVSAESQAGTTPMKERVAVIGLLNKRNGITQDMKMKPGEALRSGDAIVRLRACEATAPWEEQKEVGAFVQLDVRTPREGKWQRVFSGWVFKERPDRNVVQHPIYDVWVKSCTMSWPETGPDTLKLGESSGANARSASEPAPAENAAASSSSDTSESASDSTD